MFGRARCFLENLTLKNTKTNDTTKLGITIILLVQAMKETQNIYQKMGNMMY